MRIQYNLTNCDLPFQGRLHKLHNWSCLNCNLVWLPFHSDNFLNQSFITSPQLENLSVREIHLYVPKVELYTDTRTILITYKTVSSRVNAQRAQKKMNKNEVLPPGFTKLPFTSHWVAMFDPKLLRWKHALESALIVQLCDRNSVTRSPGECNINQQQLVSNIRP